MFFCFSQIMFPGVTITLFTAESLSSDLGDVEKSSSTLGRRFKRLKAVFKII